MAKKRYRLGIDLRRDGKLYPVGTVLDDLSDRDIEILGEHVQEVGPAAQHEKAKGDTRTWNRQPDGSVSMN